MKSGAQVVIMAVVLPRPGEPVGKLEEAVIRADRDLALSQFLNAGEREMEDWMNLIDSVSPKLSLVGLERPKGSTMSVLVLERVEEHES